jgi:hypothetical protein
VKTIFSDATGPLVQYGGGTLYIADLNPEIETRWRMSRWEMVKFGFAALFAALAA